MNIIFDTKCPECKSKNIKLYEFHADGVCWYCKNCENYVNTKQPQYVPIEMLEDLYYSCLKWKNLAKARDKTLSLMKEKIAEIHYWREEQNE